MILIDAIYINNGGGKVLLDFLISSLESTTDSYFYLLDSRVENRLPKIKESNKVLYLESSLVKRYQFYKENKASFKSILCFGNIPPLVKCECEVFTYFHQPLYIDPIPKDFGFVETIKFQIKILILKWNAKNSDKWLVQNQRIQIGLSKKFKIELNDIDILPFFPSVKYAGEVIKKIANTYIYVSNAAPHKNHKNLIEAFCDFYDQRNVGELFLTVDKNFVEIAELIKGKQELKYPIVNLGFITHSELARKYAQTEFLIFPSFAESFGLGLLEAIENNCNIIASDLPYTYAVCKPSIVFDPNSKKAITNAFVISLGKTFPSSQSLVQNKIKEIINLLHHENTK
jgi:glycosyltransferase involved in cell wall biosynthesis